MIDVKKQTKRTTRWMPRFADNIGIFCDEHSFRMGMVTTKYWGDFKEREEPLIQLEIRGNYYQMPLSEFSDVIEKAFESGYAPDEVRK